MIKKMGWNQRCLPTVSNLKNKKHLGIWIAGIVFLILALSFIAILHDSNNRRIDSILQDLDSLKGEISTGNLDVAVKSYPSLTLSDTHLVSGTKSRKKRDDDNRKKPELGSQSDGTGGAVYIRWGRTSCPDNYTELVYNGIAGGSWNGHTGAATNFQCLPNKPDWGRYTDVAGNALMYGMEYEESMEGLMDMSNLQSSLVNQNVPCAVCRSNIRASSLMIPAKNVCVKGWHLEYHGYLMAGNYLSKSGTQYICVDESPEADPAGYRDEGGALLYRVIVQCGSLPCPRYVQNRELTCVVCTK